MEGILRIDEIDRLVAEKVMGWKLCDYGFWETEDGPLDSESEWSPSTNEGDANKVVDKITKEKNLRFSVFRSGYAGGMFHGTFVTHTFEQGADVGGVWFDGFNENPYTAVCIAALKVYGVDVSEG